MKIEASKKHFKNYKHGNKLAFVIEPICEKDAKGNDTKISGPHADTPEELGRMFGEIQNAINKKENGFTVSIFGLKKSVYKSMQKSYKEEKKEKENKDFNLALSSVIDLINKNPFWDKEKIAEQIIRLKK